VVAQKANVPVMLVDTSKAALDKGLAFAGTQSGMSYRFKRWWDLKHEFQTSFWLRMYPNQESQKTKPPKPAPS
jgi:hypothetical protein